MSFQPNHNDILNIYNKTYRIAEHPYAPGMPYGQEGRQAVVYKLFGPEEEEVGLKVFKPKFRSPSMVVLSSQLDQFANIPGLAVCRRTVLSPRLRNEILGRYPDLTYAVLMPWLAGPTWMEVMLAETALTPEESLKFARFLTEVLARMEEQNTAHCDLSGPNLIMTGMLDSNIKVPVALVDVEQIYGPGIQHPDALPGGSPGYAHRSIAEGVWCPEADRFAGAVLIAEMLGWFDPRVRKSSWGESFFDPDEMQRKGKRYRLLHQVLKEKWGETIAGLFKQAWESEQLADAPAFNQWLAAFPNPEPEADSEPAEEIAEPVQSDTQVEPAEEPAPESNPGVIERYFVVCPNCLTKKEIRLDEDIAGFKCDSCEGMNLSRTVRNEIAAAADGMSDATPGDLYKFWFQTKWGFLAVGAAMLMMLGWIISGYSSAKKVNDLRTSLKTNEQKIRLIDKQLHGVKDILLKLDDSQLVKIDTIKLRNQNKDGEALSGYTNRFRQQDVRYIWYYFTLKNMASGMKNISGIISVKYFNPDGTLDRGASSPKDCSFYEEFNVADQVSISKGWGNDKEGCYEPGIHRIEFWFKGRLLNRTEFTVY